MNELIKREAKLILSDQGTGWYSIPAARKLVNKHLDDDELYHVPPFEEIRQIIEEARDGEADDGFNTEDLLLEAAEYIVLVDASVCGFCCYDDDAYELYLEQHCNTWFDEATEYMLENGESYAEECLQNLLEEEGIDKDANDFSGIISDIHLKAIDHVFELIQLQIDNCSIPCSIDIFDQVWDLFAESDSFALDKDALRKQIKEQLEAECA